MNKQINKQIHMNDVICISTPTRLIEIWMMWYAYPSLTRHHSDSTDWTNNSPSTNFPLPKTIICSFAHLLICICAGMFSYLHRSKSWDWSIQQFINSSFDLLVGSVGAYVYRFDRLLECASISSKAACCTLHLHLESMIRGESFFCSVPTLAFQTPLSSLDPSACRVLTLLFTPSLRRPTTQWDWSRRLSSTWTCVDLFSWHETVSYDVFFEISK